jgi:hypothetical protein
MFIKSRQNTKVKVKMFDTISNIGHKEYLYEASKPSAFHSKDVITIEVFNGF